jgi:putative chitinase
MANFTEGLLSLVKDKVLGKSESEISSTPKTSLSTKQLKIISKNFMSMKAMARDLNVASQNIKELVKVMGGKPSNKEDKVAGSGLTEEEREKKLQVLIEKEQKTDELKPTKVEKKSESFFEKMKKKGVDKFKKSKVGKKAIDLKKQFSENKFIKAFQKYFAIAAIVGILFLAFKDTIIEWAKGLYNTIKEKFTEFIDDIKNWFDETVKKVVDGVKEFFNTVIEKISSFFEGIGNWFVEKFQTIKDIFEPVLSFIQKVWNKFMSLLDGLKDKIRPVVQGAMSWSGKDGKITKLIQTIGLDKFVGIDTEPKQITKEEDDAEKKKLERQQKEALDTERVRKQEKEKQYTGEDEIVRKRHGIEDKTVTMRAEEKKPKVEQAPTPVPKTEAKPAPKVQVKPTPSKEKKDEKPLEVSGIQATIVESLKQSGIESPKAHANVLATVKAESNFKVQSENLNYSSPDRIQAVFGKRRIPSIEFAQQFVKNPEALANHVYKTTDGNSAEGDGYKYRGRGFIQHTGKNQYAAIAKFTGVDTLSNPDALNSPEVAAKAIPWFLLSYKRMKPEDIENMSKVNKAIAFADPTGKKAQEREASSQQIYASMTGGSGTQVASASSEVASGQRQQQKPSTPVVVNAPTTNNTIIKNNQVVSSPPSKDSSRSLVSRAA